MAEKLQQDAMAELTEALAKFSNTIAPTNGESVDQRERGYMLAYFAPGFAGLTSGLSQLIRDHGTGNPDIQLRNIWGKIVRTIEIIADAARDIYDTWHQP